MWSQPSQINILGHQLGERVTVMSGESFAEFLWQSAHGILIRIGWDLSIHG